MVSELIFHYKITGYLTTIRAFTTVSNCAGSMRGQIGVFLGFVLGGALQLFVGEELLEPVQVISGLVLLVVLYRLPGLNTDLRSHFLGMLGLSVVLAGSVVTMRYLYRMEEIRTSTDFFTTSPALLMLIILPTTILLYLELRGLRQDIFERYNLEGLNYTTWMALALISVGTASYTPFDPFQPRILPLLLHFLLGIGLYTALRWTLAYEHRFDPRKTTDLDDSELLYRQINKDRGFETGSDEP